MKIRAAEKRQIRATEKRLQSLRHQAYLALAHWLDADHMPTADRVAAISVMVTLRQRGGAGDVPQNHVGKGQQGDIGTVEAEHYRHRGSNRIESPNGNEGS